MSAFRCEEKNLVLRLLPHVLQSYHIRDKAFFDFGFELLHGAAQHGWLDVCHILVKEYNFAADDTDETGRTMLHRGCSAGDPSAVKYLLTLKSVPATVSHRDHLNHTPLELVHRNKYAIYSLFVSLVELKTELRVKAVFHIFISGN